MVAIKSANRNRDNGMLTTHARAACVGSVGACVRLSANGDGLVRTRCLRLRGPAKAAPAAHPGLGPPDYASLSIPRQQKPCSVLG